MTTLNDQIMLRWDTST